jgi:tetratricopeptide (TPR) repeat protein
MQGDVFAIQDEIAAEVVEQLQITLLGAVPKTRRTDPKAHALTLQAKHLHEKGGFGSGEQMAALVEEALALDPDYIPAMHMLVYANFYRMMEGLISDQEEMRRFHVLRDRVLAVDPDDALMQALLAFAAMDSGDVETAAAGYQRGLQSEPGNAHVLFLAGSFPLTIGRNEVAATILERSAAIDPLCFQCLYLLARTYMYMGRLDEAEAVRLRYMTLASGGRYHLVVLKLLQGDPEAALKETEGKGIDEQSRPAARAIALHDLGRQAESEDMIARLIEEWGDEHPYLVADVYAWIGDKDSAFDWLDRAYRSDKRYGRDGHFFAYNIFNPLWRNLHGDPRWDAMRERVGMSAERLAAVEFEVDLPD